MSAADAATLTPAAATATASCANFQDADGGDVASNAICRYFLRGICRFGTMCRFSHDLTGIEAEIAGPSSNISVIGQQTQQQQVKPSTSRSIVNSGNSSSTSSWANAPVFVPNRSHMLVGDYEQSPNQISTEDAATNKTWADVVGAGVERVGVITVSEAGGPSDDMVCPYENPCPYGNYCAYQLHLELCGMCDQFCLHPSDQAQRRKHNKECLQQHEQAMELSFAIARSKDKTCGICFDTIMEKSGREKRFGILPNCGHIFCLECIRKWRQAKQFEHKITRSCPECRVCSDFVCPSAFWVETKEEKDKLLNDYRTALGIKDCKYFKKGEGKCPFGNKCFYKHALPNGDLIDVGCPKRARKMHRNTNEIIDLLDIYLWEFVDQRDYHWLDLLSSTSDESDDSDWLG